MRRNANALMFLWAAVGLCVLFCWPVWARIMTVGPGELATVDLDKADLVCAGRITGQPRQLKAPHEWQSEFGWVGNAPAYEIRFLVDNVVAGSLDRMGSVIRVRYAGPPPAEPMTARFYMPDFAAIVGNRRCLLYLVHEPDNTDAYEILDGYNYLLLGEKPQNVKWEKLKPLERLAHEVSGAILSRDTDVAVHAMRSAITPQPKVRGKVVIDALLSRKSGENVQIKVYAIAALIRLDHKDTLYGLNETLRQLLAENKNNARWLGVIGESLATVTDRKAVPLLVELAGSEARSIRSGAVRALRDIRSEKAVAALAGALEDEDEWIRYHAIMGLAYQTDRTNAEWSCTARHFKKNPKPLTEKWRRWWLEEGSKKYPPVDETIRQLEQQRQDQQSQDQEEQQEPPEPLGRLPGACGCG